jgi:hypothetical protein
VNFTADNPREAQQICSELTSMLLSENITYRTEVVASTTDFLKRRLNEAKHDLVAMDAQLTASKDQKGEEKHAQVAALEYDSAKQIYADLLGKFNQAQVAEQLEREQRGEQMILLNPAFMPDSPDFPIRWMFAASGLGIGLMFGIGCALWLRYRPATL